MQVRDNFISFIAFVIGFIGGFFSPVSYDELRNSNPKPIAGFEAVDLAEHPFSHPERKGPTINPYEIESGPMGFWDEGARGAYGFQNGIYLFRSPTHLSWFIGEHPELSLVSAWGQTDIPDVAARGVFAAFEPRE